MPLYRVTGALWHAAAFPPLALACKTNPLPRLSPGGASKLRRANE
jgi:hypothetical protein